MTLLSDSLQIGGVLETVQLMATCLTNVQTVVVLAEVTFDGVDHIFLRAVG
jgi:hypothetical protein